jgi:hypothetical protein
MTKHGTFRRRSLGAMIVVAASLLATASLALVPNTCGQRFDDRLTPLPAAATGGVTIEPIVCSGDPDSPRHCLVAGFAGNDTLVLRRATSGSEPRAYRLWLHVGTSVGSGKINLSLNGTPETNWFAPPTAAFGWQLVSLPNQQPQIFMLRRGDNQLRILLPHAGDGASVAIDCVLLAADPDFVPDVLALHRLDHVWSGVGVLLDAVADDRFLYVGYYNTDRALTVAAYDRQAHVWQRKPLDNKFAGWDNHNAIALALDHAGNLHIAGNMHASPLVYGHTLEPGHLDGLKLINRMTGAEEARTTYPTWIDLQDGRLGFMYRSGVSGAGSDLVNVYDGANWSRLLASAMFAVPPGAPSASAYPTAPVHRPDGYIHMAWAWRRTADASTSFQVAYARSRDFIHWETAAGKPLTLPLGPGQGDIIDNAPEHSGLWNEVNLGFDPEARPIVSYVKFDAAGNTQLFDARPDRQGWQIVQVSDWHDRWDMRGYGTIIALVRQWPVGVEDGALVQEIRHWKAGRFQYVLDPASLRPVATRPIHQLLPAALLQPSVPNSGFTPLVVAAHQAGLSTASPKFVLRWEAQASNRDEQPACNAEYPLACNPPPSQLVVFERP